MRYVLFGAIATASFIVASVVSSLITTTIRPDTPGELKLTPEPRIGEPKPQQQPPKPAAEPPKPADPKPAQEPARAPEPEQPGRAEEEIQVTAAPPPPRQTAPPPRQTGPGNLESPPPRYQRGPGNIDSYHAPVYTPRPTPIGPGNL
jgi:hypothetical protein